MQQRTPWLTILLMFLHVMLAACGDDSSRDGTSCPGTPSSGCEEVVADVDECPRLEDVCDNVCGAAYDCCYCGDDGQWTTLYLDCPQCVDAGMDAFGSDLVRSLQ